MHLQESGEMYLETIYVLSRSGKAVRAIDICEHMGYSKPSVSRAMSILKQGGFVVADADGFLHLTDSGMAVARKIYDRHTVLTRLLVSMGVEEKTAAEDACKMEHAISDATYEAICRYLNK